MRFFLPLAIFFVLAGFLWKSLSLNASDQPAAVLSKATPVFRLPNLENPNEFVTEEILNGKITILNFWASWCSACQQEHGFWLSLAKTLTQDLRQTSNKTTAIINRAAADNTAADASSNTSSPPIQLVGVSVHDDPDEAKVWLKELGNPYNTVILDEQGQLAMEFGLYGTPETFILDPKGVVRLRYTGLVNEKIWRDKIIPLIQQLKSEDRKS